ncbi:MAG: hypothetical protein IKC52_03040 [Clostridia bacterium]|nr:hypothetical protein [Clostridia bacterium]
MKKILVLALAVVMVLGVVAFAACAQPQTVTGECKYDNYGHTYGAKVDVTVLNGVITSVKLYTEEETGWVRTSADNPDYGWTSHDAVEAAYEGFLKQFEGKPVEEVKAYVATATAEAQTVGEGVPSITGGTQSAARIIVAIQDALSKLA